MHLVENAPAARPLEVDDVVELLRELAAVMAPTR
ncbi:hypothetical protein SAMN05421872_107304 [Nocardioides lianchengensis]|jgi:hypothetical protein|uniref:Uncharacterized protein n=1 Tax=Nocardioides lianchengensis TaxID=1045774 RepID=A0A1G6U4A1_9ACTN|nr:hypothetical protein [Nocardioides lianchengensis]SDD36252.1 hypothetical protein SAMN05421872_107304 [Nocardioides lianchengensis]